MRGANVSGRVQTSSETLSATIQEYLRTSGYSQKELAEAVGLHPKVLSRKLHGSAHAHLTHLELKRIIITLQTGMRSGHRTKCCICRR